MSDKAKNVTMSFRTSTEVYEFLQKLHEKYDRSTSYVINDLIKYFLNNPPDSIPINKKK